MGSSKDNEGDEGDEGDEGSLDFGLSGVEGLDTDSGAEARVEGGVFAEVDPGKLPFEPVKGLPAPLGGPVVEPPAALDGIVKKASVDFDEP